MHAFKTQGGESLQRTPGRVKNIVTYAIVIDSFRHIYLQKFNWLLQITIEYIIQ